MQDLTRRAFLIAPAVGTAAARITLLADEKPAILGGKPVRKMKYPGWPVFDQQEEQALLAALRSGKWFRGNGKEVARFEEAYATITGAKFCLATANGTSALFTSLNAIGVGPGDEVLIPPYTFVATLNVVLLQHALPVWVDVDPETCQMDPRKLDAAITDRTTAIIPVHYGGNPADLDAILAIAKKRQLRVIEDACQAHLAAWRGRNVGNWGDTGTFSFQASKNLNSGEGGAIITNDETLMDRCYSFHNQGRKRKGSGDDEFSYFSAGNNLRLTEFQAAVLLAQMTRLEEQSKTREQNAQYLNNMLKEIPGVMPQRSYDGCTRHNHHTYVFRYDKDKFAGLTKPRLLRALTAEGIPARGGYTPLNKVEFLRRVLQSRIYRNLYPKERLAQVEKIECPGNEKLCCESVVFSHNVLMAPRSEMELIVAAVRKVQANAAAIAKT